jgi:hypothetical protein
MLLLKLTWLSPSLTKSPLELMPFALPCETECALPVDYWVGVAFAWSGSSLVYSIGYTSI